MKGGEIMNDETCNKCKLAEREPTGELWCTLWDIEVGITENEYCDQFNYPGIVDL